MIIFIFKATVKLQPTGGPHNFLRTHLRAALAKESGRRNELTERPLFTNNYLHYKYG
jgi:hypothetical protein